MRSRERGAGSVSRRKCSNHCSACGSHFTSLAAFDAHRYGSHQDGRRCWNPEEELPLVIQTEIGVCDITAETLEPVTIWGHKSAERAKDYFGARRASQRLGKAESGLPAEDQEAA